MKTGDDGERGAVPVRMMFSIRVSLPNMNARDGEQQRRDHGPLFLRQM